MLKKHEICDQINIFSHFLGQLLQELNVNAEIISCLSSLGKKSVLKNTTIIYLPKIETRFRGERFQNWISS